MVINNDCGYKFIITKAFFSKIVYGNCKQVFFCLLRSFSCITNGSSSSFKMHEYFFHLATTSFFSNLLILRGRPSAQAFCTIFHISFCQKMLYLPQHFLYFLPLPQGQGSLRPVLSSGFTNVSPAVSGKISLKSKLLSSSSSSNK